MNWRIHSWDECSKTGFVASPHYGPWPFGPKQNDHKTEFVIGEAVTVELEGPADGYQVLQVRARRAEPQPKNTAYPPFDVLNGFANLSEEDNSTHERIQLWVGECCPWCGSGARVVFEGSCGLIGYDEEIGIESPHFRRASKDEVQEMGLRLDGGRRAFCIVDTVTAADRPRPRVFVVATDVQVENLPLANARRQQNGGE